jgi:hypothetical protein
LEKQVKKYLKAFFDKAVAKKKEHDRKKAEKAASKAESTSASTKPAGINLDGTPDEKKDEESDPLEGMDLSEDEADQTKEKPVSMTPITPLDTQLTIDSLKRKRHAEGDEDLEASPSKRSRGDSPRADTPPPPPPPPPPPAEGMPEDQEMLDDAAYDEASINDSPGQNLDDSHLTASTLGNGVESEVLSTSSNGGAAGEDVTTKLHDLASAEMDMNTMGANGEEGLDGIDALHGAAIETQAAH